jgi:hypothetical protein
MWDDNDPIWDNIDPRWDDIDPIRDNIDPRWDDIDPISNLYREDLLKISLISKGLQ